MGWWEQSSSRWEACIVAQVGGAAVVGGGGFFIQFRTPDMTVKPCFLALAIGVGAGGSIGSAVSIPWSDVVRQLINPHFRPPTDSYGWSNLDGTFSCQNIQRASFSITSVGGSAIVVGAQYCMFAVNGFSFAHGPCSYFNTRLNIPSDLPSLGQAVLNTPQMQGALSLGAFAFTGSLFYVGVN